MSGRRRVGGCAGGWLRRARPSRGVCWHAVLMLCSRCAQVPEECPQEVADLMMQVSVVEVFSNYLKMPEKAEGMVGG